MTDDRISAGDAPQDNEKVKRPLWQRILKWIGIAILSLLALIAVVLLGINTDPGRRFVADQIGGYTTASGLNIKVGRIDGSLYGKMILRDVRVADPKGVFLTSPKLDLDWRPFAFINNHVDVRSLGADLITLRRRPELKPTPSDPNAPLLPDLDIDVNRLRIGRFIIGKPVTGQTHMLNIAGAVHIADRRAQLQTNVNALAAAGVAGGDRLTLRLDAVPDENKLDLNLKLNAPAGGVIATLGGLKQPLRVSVDGRGSWKAWDGRAIAMLGNGQLANLNLTARDGRIKVRGQTRPGLYLAGPVERLTSPALNVAIDTTLQERRADTRIKLKSDALAVDAGGLIDLANSRFGNFAVDAQLLTPGSIAPNLRGRDVAARIVLNGAFARPTVDYKLRAAAIGFGTTTAEDIYVEGLARVSADRILVPIKGRVRRVTGLNPAVGSLLTNVTLDGDIAYNNGSVLSDNLRLHSDRIDATAVIAADVTTGRYTGALKGRVNNYRLESIGILDLSTDADLVPSRNGGFGIKARVVARTSQIFNDGVRNFLGGNAIVRADIGYDPAGLVTFSGLKVSAPQFRVTNGGGRYNLSNGAVAVTADAYSTQYGAITARVTGSATDPVIVLTAEKPGLGVGLNGLKARVVGRNGAYAIVASGGTNYGPFTADVLVRPTPRLTVDINRVTFAGVNFLGRIAQTAAGPFAGQLTFAGSGLNGNVRLAAQGKYQRADVNARAYSARIPGAVDFTIGRAIITANAVLYPNAPQVIADAQVADLKYGALVLSSARAKVNYKGGRGTAQAVLTGSNGVPFNLALNATLSPSEYVAALKGAANGIDFRTINPAKVNASGGTYRLSPTRIDFGTAGKTGGSVRVAGSYGRGTSARVRLDSFDLSTINALVPDLGLGGRITGALDYNQASSAAVPQVTARARVAGFTRSGIAAVSTPVDVDLRAGLDTSGGDMRANILRGQTVVGRIVATLRPLGAGVSWSERLLAAPLSGGIRYNGPSGVLFSLAALPKQQLTGPIAVAADFGGRLQSPRINGQIRADNLTYDNETFGTRLSQMQVRATFDTDRLTLQRLQAKAGDGTVQAQGTIGLAAAQGFPLDVTAKLDNAQLAKSDALSATTTGTLHVTKGPNGGLIQGKLTIPEARYQIIRQGQAEVPELTGVRRKGAKAPTPEQQQAIDAAGVFKLDLDVRAQNQLFVSGMGLDSEWSLKMHIGGTSANPVIDGGLDIVKGAYSFAGKRFEITKGQIRFRGGALTDPSINISATTTANGITAIINITGTGERPQISFTSSPVLAQDEVLSRLLFGTNPENLSATEAIQLAAALNSLRGSGGGGLNPVGKLRSITGLDRLRIVGADKTTGQGTSLAAGKYITKNVYVEIVTDARGYTATQLEIALTKTLSLLSSTGSFGGSNGSLKYSRDFK